MPQSERLQLQQQDETHGCILQRLTNASGMRAHEIDLQLRQIAFSNARAGKLAKPRIHTIDCITAFQHTQDSGMAFGNRLLGSCRNGKLNWAFQDAAKISKAQAFRANFNRHFNITPEAASWQRRIWF